MIRVRSFAKINLGLCIGESRPDGFHQLCTAYQTIALHDPLTVDVVRGSGIEIRCEDPRVPRDSTNTAYRIADRVMSSLGRKGKVIIVIDKRLPVQGGLGGASSNGVATLLALERVLKKQLPGPEKFRIAAEVGSDLPLFLIGGTVLGVGRGEQVFPLPDLPSSPCVLATPDIGVSTPRAFQDWDENVRQAATLTDSPASDRINEFGRRVSSWLSGFAQTTGRPASGVPASGRGRAETPLLDLVRTGIENDFERVVFPKYPELREIKRVLDDAGASYASLSGSGSALLGLFCGRAEADKAAARLRKAGIPALSTTTLTRQQYRRKFLVSGL
jgi:4-diphosphocytidyl-2-C-methyl-D-erythritol kinase